MKEESSIDDLETGKTSPKQDDEGVVPKSEHHTTMLSSQTTSSNTNATTTNTTTTAAFVDYVPPPEKPIPPPAVYKLALIIATAVYLADWVASEANVVAFLTQYFSLSSEGALLVFLATMVFVLVYGTLDLMIILIKIKIPIVRSNGGSSTSTSTSTDDVAGDNQTTYSYQYYGIETWLKQPRIRWIHGYPNNFVMECLASTVSILEDGLDIFKKENVVTPPKVKQFEEEEHEDDRQGDILLRIESPVKPDRLQDYIQWREKLLRLGARPGMKQVDYTTSPSSSSSSLDDNNGESQEPHLFVTHILFDSLDALNDFMASPFRERMLRKLQPLLVAPLAMQLCQQRCLADAFTDLCHGGQCVPKRNPKKWKVWMLTTLSLWIVLQFTGSRLPPYLQAWGLVPYYPRAAAAVSVLINVSCNSYLGIPFFTMLFGHWMKRKEDCHDRFMPQPWRTLNDGFDSTWSKLAVTVAFYGGCTLAWILKSNV
eukprot:scaffold4674_cov188-Amphora_coffeaeformis.AAC.5